MPKFPDRLEEIATELDADLTDIESLEEAQMFLHEMVAERRGETLEAYDALEVEIDYFENDDEIDQNDTINPHTGNITS